MAEFCLCVFVVVVVLWLQNFLSAYMLEGRIKICNGAGCVRGWIWKSQMSCGSGASAHLHVVGVWRFVDGAGQANRRGVRPLSLERPAPPSVSRGDLMSRHQLPNDPIMFALSTVS